MAPTNLLLAASLLALAMPAASAGPLDGSIDARCDFSVHSGAAPNTVQVTLVGHAVAPAATSAPAVVSATGIQCELFDADGNPVLDLHFLVNGPAAAGAATGEFAGAAPLTVCTFAYAYYTPSGYLETERTCVTP